MFNCDNTASIVLEREDFVNMFREDSKTERILEFLNTSAKAQSIEIKAASRCESAPSAALYKSSSDVVPTLKYCTVDEYIKLLRSCWKFLQPVEDVVHITRIGEFLAEKNVASNKHEGIRIMKEVSSSSYVSYLEFEKVFLKAIFKASLMNLAVGLNHGDLGASDASLRLKLSTYQRYLMINGSNPDFEFKLGRNALQAINKYIEGRPEISRNKIVKEIKATVAHADEQHKDRIKAYLYRIKRRAKEFVNEHGEVMQNYTNHWDIRDIVLQKYCKNIPTVLEEEQTFDEAKYLNELLKERKIKVGNYPIDRKIKAFRENYIYERYQKTVKKTKENK